MDLWEVAACAAVAALAGAAGGLAVTAGERRRLRRLAALLRVAFRVEARAREAAAAARKLSRRPRRRYIVFEVVPAGIPGGELEPALERSFEVVAGTVGLAASAFKLLDYDERSGRGIVRVRLGYRHAALAAMGLLRRIGDRRVLIYPLAVTGSVKRARRLMGRR